MKLPLILIGGGICLMVAALIVPSVLGGPAGFSDELRREIAESGRLHEEIERLHAEGAAEADHEAAHQALLQTQRNLQERAEAARNRGQGVANVMKWSGILAASAGLAMLLVQRSRAT